MNRLKQRIFIGLLVLAVLLMIGCEEKTSQSSDVPADEPVALSQSAEETHERFGVVEGYVTAETCRQCHSAEYNEWKGTTHARDYRNLILDETTMEEDMPNLQWGTEENPIRYNISFYPNNEFTTFMKGDDYYVTLHDSADSSKDMTFRIDGLTSTMQKQFITYDYPSRNYPGEESRTGLIMPFSWFDDGKVARFAAFYTRVLWWNQDGTLKDISDDAHYEEQQYMGWDNHCVGCHTTGSEVLSWEKSETHGLLVKESNSKTGVESGISCEHCHGPGADHVSSMKAEDILNPSNLSSDRNNDVCIKCHQQQGGHELNPGYVLPYKYNEEDPTLPGKHYENGEDLSEYVSFSTPYQFLGTGFHSNAKNGPVEMAESAHGKAGLTCVACHNGHTNELKSEGDSLCLQCHTDIGDNHKLPVHSENDVTCINCHFVYTQTTRKMFDGANHVLKPITPSDTLAVFDRLEPYSRGETGPEDTPREKAMYTKIWKGVQAMGGVDSPVTFSAYPYPMNHNMLAMVSHMPNSCSSCHTDEFPRQGYFTEEERNKLLKAEERYERFLEMQE